MLLTGNEAIALGAFEAGATLGSAYPGTPSTEIMENFANYENVYAEWAPNEKVALEVAIGAAIGGRRAIAAMKHVGLNVAADPLFTAVYTGLEAGLVIVDADDPGMHSSQNEQDNRYYALSSKIIMIEPSDSQEAKDFTKQAFSISEEFDLPVMIRTTTRISHSRSIVTTGEKESIEEKKYKKNAAKYVMVPANARVRHKDLLDRLTRVTKFSNASGLNRIEMNSSQLGIITSGISYQLAKEVFPDASFLKLGMTHPLPTDLIIKFSQDCQNIWVIEELEPFLEVQIKSLSISVLGKEVIPLLGELLPEIIYNSYTNHQPVRELALKHASPDFITREALDYEPPVTIIRPPNLCPGCPHRSVFYALKKMNTIITGDIGCYTLSVMPPLEAMDTCICMGASISAAHGLDKSGASGDKKVVAVIGDSTFVHSGITSLIDIYYNQGKSMVIILDNRTTAMTGRQDHPGTGLTLQGREVQALDFVKLGKAIGFEIVKTIDPYNLKETEQILKECLAMDKPSLIITNRPCVLIEKTSQGTYLVVDEKCDNCKRCLRIGCPAISFIDESIDIDQTLCTGCDICSQLCNADAIINEGV